MTFKKGHTNQIGKNNSFYGKKHSIKNKENWSKNKKGKDNPMFGKHHTEETKDKMRKKLNEKEIIKKYKSGQNIKKLGKEYNCSFSHIYKILKRNNIDTTKYVKEHIRELGLKNKGKIMSEETKKKVSMAKKGQKSWCKGLTKETDARLMKSSLALKGKIRTKEHCANLSKSLKGKLAWSKGLTKETDERVRKFSEAMQGENSHLWKGGKSFEPYDKTFNNQFKNAIRKRDNQICLMCGVHREKLKKALSIHHINYDKLLTIPQNCVSLCNSCHTITNFNREKWTPFFQEILAKQYGYKYSKEGDIILKFKGRNNDG